MNERKWEKRGIPWKLSGRDKSNTPMALSLHVTSLMVYEVACIGKMNCSPTFLQSSSEMVRGILFITISHVKIFL